MNKDLEFIYIKTDKEAERAVNYLGTFKRLGYDTETNGLEIVSRKSRLLLMQLATEEVAYIFDARKINTEILRPILESQEILKLLHGGKFDYQMTRIWTDIKLDCVFDTMLAYRLLTSGLIEDGKGGYVSSGFRDKNKKTFPYKGLNFLTQKFLGITLDKSVRQTFADQDPNREFTPAQLKYAGEDVVVLHPLVDILGQMLADEDLVDTALLEFAFIVPVSEMELNGVYINQEKWRAVINEAQRQSSGFESKIKSILHPLCEQNTLFGEVMVDINSPDQLMRFFKKLGFEMESTEQKVLKGIKHELADYILQYRAYEKLITTYGEAILDKIQPATGRLHFTLHQLGADTGRLSSEKPNIQNIPKDKDDPEAEVAISFRECFEASPGCMIITADFSQCELRILAEVSQDRKFLEIFKNNQDLHIITSQQVFGYSDNDLTIYLKVKKKDKPGNKLEEFFSPEEICIYKKVADFRDKTKTINFGIVYGLSAFSLTERFKIQLDEAERILNSYFKTYSGIKRWLEKNAHETISNRYAKTILGRKKYFTLPDPDDEETFRRARGAVRRMGNNHTIQGTNADITKRSLIDLQKAYEKVPGAKILFTVHDEIVSECPEEIADQVSALKAQVMRDAFHVYIKTVPVGPEDKVSTTVAKHWSK